MPSMLTPLPKLKPSLSPTGSRLLPRRPKLRPRPPNSKLRRTPGRLPSMLKLNSKELLPRRLELCSPPSKLETMRLLPLLLKLPS